MKKINSDIKGVSICWPPWVGVFLRWRVLGDTFEWPRLFPRIASVDWSPKRRNVSKRVVMIWTFRVSELPSCVLSCIALLLIRSSSRHHRQHHCHGFSFGESRRNLPKSYEGSAEVSSRVFPRVSKRLTLWLQVYGWIARISLQNLQLVCRSKLFGYMTSVVANPRPLFLQMLRKALRP